MNNQASAVIRPWQIFELRLALLLCLGALPVSALATTVTGTLTDASGAPLTGTLVLTLSQPGSSGGTSLGTNPVKCAVIAGSVTACTVVGNDVISPAGTTYKIKVLNAAGGTNTAETAYSIEGATWNLGDHTPVASTGVTSSAYQTVALNGTAAQQRRKLNFTGSGVTVADNATTGATDVTISATGVNEANEEGPAGQINGVNKTFTLAHTPNPATSLRLVYRGMTLRSGASYDFTLSGNTITMNYAPTTGGNLIAWYEY
jgi:hypothetical protein